MNDAISRQAALEQTYLWSKDEFLRVTNPFDYLRKRIKDLPPVNPQPKTGHWYYDEEREATGIYAICSNCDEEIYQTGDFKYCPNCGARMVEIQESDHKCHTCKHYTSGEHDGSCGSYICKGYSNWESEVEE